jgi:hypothetical protein
MIAPERQYSVAAAAELLGVSTRTIRRYYADWIKSAGTRGLGPVILQRGRVFFRASTLRQFQDRNELAVS